MIVKEESRNVVSSLGGESQQFRIAVTGKAFSVLVAGIYSDKIGSIVREITSNAFDAHIRNGNPQVPFEVRLPNALNPNFSVRDFGCSMTHETVMGLYSTLFESSKAASNDEVGSFGLGAKSVFAYSDAFTVNCWLDGERRAYAVAKDAEGIPAVTLVHTESSNDPQGVEVTFAVSPSDFNAFLIAFNKAALGFDVLPKVVGGAVQVPEPKFSGKGWRVYKDLVGSTNYVRQGCAVYPATFNTSLPYEYHIIIDVPIGEANVTASREALALTHEQNDEIIRKKNAAVIELNTQVVEEYRKLTNDLEKAWFAYRNESLLGTFASQCPKYVKTAMKVTNYHDMEVDAWRVENIARIMLVVDDPAVVVRRKKLRLKHLSRKHDVYVTCDPTVVIEMVTKLGLEQKQVIKMEDTPDVYVASRGNSGPREKKVLNATRPWAYALRGKAWTESQYGRTWKITETPFVSGRLHGWISQILCDLDPLGILYLTPVEAEKALRTGKIVEDNRIDRVVIREVGKIASEVREHVLSRTFSHTTGGQLLSEIANLKPPTNNINGDLYNLFQTHHQAQFIGFQRESNTILREFQGRYPLLFDTSRDAIAAYIQMIDQTNLTASHNPVVS